MPVAYPHGDNSDAPLYGTLGVWRCPPMTAATGVAAAVIGTVA